MSVFCDDIAVLGLTDDILMSFLCNDHPPPSVSVLGFLVSEDVFGIQLISDIAKHWLELNSFDVVI